MPPLTRPDGLGDDEWTAIVEAEQRLLRANGASDLSLVVGAAKELCEAVAKVVIAERGQVSSPSADMPALINTCHKLLEFQPGEGLATDPGSRRVAQGLKSLVLGVSEMRNYHGTGHGRASPSGATTEHAALARTAASLWTEWALRRLEPYIAGDITTLVRDLESRIFHRGDLARRLVFANLARRPVEDQTRVGIAVARRAMRNTEVIRQDGISSANAGDTSKWPPAYIEGLLVGLFFDVNGYFRVRSAWQLREAARLIEELPTPEPVLERLLEQAADAADPETLAESVSNPELVNALREAQTALPEGRGRELWTWLLYPLASAKGSGAGGDPLSDRSS